MNLIQEHPRVYDENCKEDSIQFLGLKGVDDKALYMLTMMLWCSIGVSRCYTFRAWYCLFLALCVSFSLYLSYLKYKEPKISLSSLRNFALFFLGH